MPILAWCGVHCSHFHLVTMPAPRRCYLFLLLLFCCVQEQAEETPFQKQMRKRREKRKEKRQQLKQKAGANAGLEQWK